MIMAPVTVMIDPMQVAYSCSIKIAFQDSTERGKNSKLTSNVSWPGNNLRHWNRERQDFQCTGYCLFIALLLFWSVLIV